MNTIMFCVIVFDMNTCCINNNIWYIYLFYVMGMKMYEALSLQESFIYQIFYAQRMGIYEAFYKKASYIHNFDDILFDR